MVPLFILDKKSPLLRSAMEKVSTSTSPKLFMKSAKADQELSKCLGASAAGEFLLKSYVCARHKDILVQGRLLLTENWICFYSNIIGWETKTTINLKDVTAILKQRTALVFPNAIQIETEKKKYMFSSFMHRDRAHQVMVALWENYKQSKPVQGEALKLSLSNHKRDKEDKASQSSSVVGVACSDTSTLLSHSPSPTSSCHDNSMVTTSALPSSGDDLSDWTDASLDMDSSSEDTARATKGGNSSHTTRDKNFRNNNNNSSSSSDQSHASVVSMCSSSDSNWQEDAVLEENRCKRPLTSSSNNYSTTNMTTPTQTLSTGATPIQTTPRHVGVCSPDGATPQEDIYCWSNKWYHMLWQNLLPRLCASTMIINLFILLFICVLLVSLLSMVCRLCQVEPSLHVYLPWQPWCSCLAPPTSAPTLPPSPG